MVKTKTATARRETAPRKRDQSAPRYIILLIAAAVGAYLNSFTGQFIIDDQLSIVKNDVIRRLWPLGGLFSSSRPLVDFSLAINYTLGGLTPWGYHVFNLLVHILAGLTLFGLIRRTPAPAYDTRTKDFLAFCCALIWLVHPLQTQAVTYVIQRSESMMGLCYLVTLYYLVRGATAERFWPWYIAGIAACVAGMASKAVMLSAPLVALLYDRTFLSSSFLESLRKRWPFHLGLAASWLMLGLFGIIQGVFTSHAADPITVGFGYAALTPWQYLRTQPEILLHYLRLAILPIGQCVDYGWPVQNKPLIWAGAGAIILAMLSSSVWALYRRRPAGFLGVAFFLILAPTSSFIPIRDLAFEHRMYLPLACVIILIVFGAARLLHRSGSSRNSRTLAAGLAIVAAMVCLIATVRRNQLYGNPIALWSDTARKAEPNHPRPHNALGYAMLNARKTNEAIVEFRRALALDPYYAGAHANLGNAMLFRGDYARAVQKYREALAISPYEFDEEIHFLFGSALLELKQYQEAAGELDLAVQIQPNYAEAWCNLGNAWRGLTNYGKAEAALRRAISIRPQYPEAFANLGIVLSESGQRQPAIDAFSQALTLASHAKSPRDLALHCHLKLADLFRSGAQIAEARKHYEAALAIDPANGPARQGLGTNTQP